MNYSACFGLMTLFPHLTQDATLICCLNWREIFADKKGMLGHGREHTKKLQDIKWNA